MKRDDFRLFKMIWGDSMEHTRISWGFIGIFQQRNGCNKILLFVYSSGTKDKNTRDLTKTWNRGIFIDIGYLRPMGIWLVVPGTIKKIWLSIQLGMSCHPNWLKFFRGVETTNQFFSLACWDGALQILASLCWMLTAAMAFNCCNKK